MKENIVPAVYEAPEDNIEHFTTYQDKVERLFELLEQQGYELIKIKDRFELKDNLRRQIERLNSLRRNKEFRFSDSEWNWFFEEYFENKTIEENTETIQKNYVKSLKTDDEDEQNIYLIDKEHVYKNHLQVFQPLGDQRNLIILVNGLPLVFIELFEVGERLENRFGYLDRYDKYDYLSDFYRLFWFIQLFVFSNHLETKYCSNTSNLAWIRRARISKAEDTNFRLTSYWTDSQNKRILGLIDFTKYFLNKNALLNILTKYCVFTTDKKLLVMRPYQINAVEEMVKKVKIGIEKKLEGTPEARGYIWHATGSGKTLTSWKAVELISNIEGISKVIFVVDRKVLDSQTQREFHKFGDTDKETQTNNTYELIQKLNKSSCRIISTTFQKLNKACKHENFSELPILQERVVFIFDECHRSQGSDDEMGQMRRITEDRFKKCFIFGVSGTPILPQKSKDEKEKDKAGTNKYFTKPLCSYNLLHALQDNNVLSWRYDEVRFKKSESTEREVQLPYQKLEKKRKIVDWVLENFERKTKGSSFKKHFNSIFVAESIADLLEYYEIFKEKSKDTGIVISAIFSISSDEAGNVKGHDAISKIIEDYNQTFKTGFDLKFDIGKGYETWREDLTKRLRNVEIDILIVVAMFLTGFDSPALNTLWIDKKINSPHDLIQIFSRTNRIHSELKDVGNIVSFVPLAEKRDKALSMYASSTGDVNTPCMLFEANFDKQYASAKELIEEFRQIYPNTQSNIKDKDIGDFMNRYCQVLKTHKKLSCYSEYKNKELLSADEKVNYNIKYLGCRDKIIAQRKASQEVFETEMPIDIDESALELIRSENVDINWILWLISKGEEKKKIMQKVYCNTRIRSCAPLIDEFIDKWEGTEKHEDLSVDKEWKGFISNKQNEELDEIISEFNFKIGERENIKEVLLEEEKDKILQGNWLRNILPHSSYFDTASQEQIKKAKSALLELMNRWEQYRI